MKELVKLNLILSFRWKSFLLVSGYLLLLAMARVFLTSNEAEPVEVNLWDFLIQSQGGLKVDASVQMWKYAGWVGSLAPLLFFSHHIAGLTHGYDLFLLTRSGSRSLWWSAKLVSVMILAVLYGTWFLLIHCFAGICFFSVEEGWSPYFSLAFPELVQLHMEPWYLLGIIWAVFVLGTITVTFAILTTTLFFRNTTHAYVLVTVFLFGLGAMYLYGWVSKRVALFFYPSLLDSFQQGQSSLQILGDLLSMNIMFLLFCVVIGLFKIRRYNLSWTSS